MKQGVADILEARASSYGDYGVVAKITLAIIETLKKGENWDNLDAVSKLSFMMIANKLARIVNGTLKEDSLKDIQGYVQLILENSKNITT